MRPDTKTTTMSNSSALVSKVWNFANVLRDDGVSYGDYLEQVTFLLFFKMAEEYTKGRCIRCKGENLGDTYIHWISATLNPYY